MSTTRKFVALSALPVLLAAGHGVAAAAPGQPGLAVPGEGQPGLSQGSQPPAPSLADYIPEPPAPPARPRPSQQVPDLSTLTGDDPAPDADPEPDVTPVPDPHTLRLGTSTVALPDVVDARTRDKAQAYADYAEWQIAAAYDSMGFSREESDRRAASTVAGGATGAYLGGLVGPWAPAILIGCLPGGLVGAAVGGLVAGIPTLGVAAGPGIGIGASVGCAVGAMVAVAPTVVASAALGALVGGTVGGLLGAGTDVPQPETTPPPLIEIAAPTPTSAATTVGHISDAAAAIAASSPEADAVVDSLRTAVASMPELSAEVLGPLAAPVNDFVAAVQRGL